MKRTIIALAVLSILAFGVGANADLQNSAVANVRVLVSPNVSIAPVSPNIDAGSVQTGPFTASIDFTVDANKQEVSFFAEASDLFKGDDPTNTTVAPLPVNLSTGVLVTPANGNATHGHGNTMAFIGSTGGVVNGFPTHMTETVQFSSSQNNHFSQNVNVKVAYTQPDPEQPTGEYSGVVRLTAIVAAQ